MSYPNGYNFRATIVVNKNKIPSNQANFPLLIYGTYNDFKTITNLGKVNNTTTLNGITVPADLIITDSSNTPLNWEVGFYDATTGKIEIWVNTTLSSIANTVFFIYYGKLSITVYQCTATSTWNSNYQGIFHLTTITTGSGAIKDSTINSRNGTVHGTVGSGTGIIDGAASFSTTVIGNDIENISRPVQDDFTITFWLKTTQTGLSGPSFFQVTGLVDAEVGGIVNDFSIGLKVNNISFGVGNPDITINGSKIVNDGNWHLVAITRTKSTGAMKIYVDSFSSSDGSGTGNTNSLTAPTTVNFGDVLAGPGGNGYIGLLDEVTFSDNIRNSDYLTTLFNNQSSPSTFYGIFFGSGQKSLVSLN